MSKWIYLIGSDSVVNLDGLKTVIPNCVSEGRWKKRSYIIFKYYSSEDVSLCYGTDDSYERSTSHYQEKMEEDFRDVCNEIGIELI